MDIAKDINAKSSFRLILSRILIPLFLGGAIIISIKFYHFRSHGLSQEDVQLSGLQDGDLVFRRGRSIESFAVCLAGEEKEFSHVGMVIIQSGKPFIIHAVPGESGHAPEYIKMERPRDFLEPGKASHFAVYRPLFGKDILRRASSEAYGFYKGKCTFDRDYDLETEDKLYCTELIIKAFRNAGLKLEGITASELDLVFIKKQLILPGAILKNISFLRIIQN